MPQTLPVSGRACRSRPRELIPELWSRLPGRVTRSRQARPTRHARTADHRRPIPQTQPRRWSSLSRPREPISGRRPRHAGRVTRSRQARPTRRVGHTGQVTRSRQARPTRRVGHTGRVTRSRRARSTRGRERKLPLGRSRGAVVSVRSSGRTGSCHPGWRRAVPACRTASGSRTPRRSTRPRRSDPSASRRRCPRRVAPQQGHG